MIIMMGYKNNDMLTTKPLLFYTLFIDYSVHAQNYVIHIKDDLNMMLKSLEKCLDILNYQLKQNNTSWAQISLSLSN